jgi:hypothetical protein
VGVVTADEFERQAADRLRTTVEQLRSEGQVVVPCDCDYVGCDGWQLMSRQLAAHLDGSERQPTMGEVIAAGSTAIRASMEFEESMRQVRDIVAYRS